MVLTRCSWATRWNTEMRLVILSAWKEYWTFYGKTALTAVSNQQVAVSPPPRFQLLKVVETGKTFSSRKRAKRLEATEYESIKSKLILSYRLQKNRDLFECLNIFWYTLHLNGRSFNDTSFWGVEWSMNDERNTVLCTHLREKTSKLPSYTS